MGDMFKQIYQQLEELRETSFKGEHKGHKYRVKFSLLKIQNSEEEIMTRLKLIVKIIHYSIENYLEMQQREVFVSTENRWANINGCDYQTSLEFECEILGDKKSR